MSQAPDVSSQRSAVAATLVRPVDLGPFSPPPDYAFEPEFEAPVPRPIPRETSRGRHAVGRRRAIYIVLWIAVFALLLAPLPFVKELGKYFTPFEYLRWIGYGALLMAGVGVVAGYLVPGPYRYIREGLPLVARVVSLIKAPSLVVEGAPRMHAIVAKIEFRDPDTGQLRTAEAKSNDFSSSERGEFTTSFKVGDYVTAVYLPGAVARSIKLYGFLDLMPDVGLLRWSKSDGQWERLWKIPALMLFIIGFFGALIWDIVALGRYQPLNFGVSEGLIPFAVGVIVLGGAFFGGIWALKRKEARRRAERNAAAVAAGEPVEVDPASAAAGKGIKGWGFVLILGFGGALLGGGTALCWSFTVNALFDRSPPQFRPVQITEMIVTTHNFIFREYTMKYKLAGDPETHRLMTSPDHLDTFRANIGIAEIHAGRLGWPWVKTVHPLNPAAGADVDEE